MKVNKCVWTYNTRNEDYDTSCDANYWFSCSYGPEEEGFDYCPFCGYPLVVKESEEE